MVEARVGDIVKSLDFPGNPDHYMVGEVFAVINDILFCNTLRVVRDGLSSYEALCMNREFRAPVDGAHFMDQSFPGRITLVQEAVAA